jgi:hypothetical protein
MHYNTRGFGRRRCHVHRSMIPHGRRGHITNLLLDDYHQIGTSDRVATVTHVNTKVISHEVGNCVATWSLLPRSGAPRPQEVRPPTPNYSFLLLLLLLKVPVGRRGRGRGAGRTSVRAAPYSPVYCKPVIPEGSAQRPILIAS